MIGKDYANLWSTMTSYIYRDGEPSEEGDALLEKLSSGARYPGQEVRLRAFDDGWELEVFSCYGGTPTRIIKLSIPRDRQENPILTVREGTR